MPFTKSHISKYRKTSLLVLIISIAIIGSLALPSQATTTLTQNVVINDSNVLVKNAVINGSLTINGDNVYLNHVVIVQK